MVTFANLEPGKNVGQVTFCVTSDLLKLWYELYPLNKASGIQTIPAGMAMVVFMRAYMAILPFRPPGGVHARQRLELRKLPCLGEFLKTQLRCTGKEFKKGRRWVHFVADTWNERGELMFSGELSSIWPE